MADLAVKILLQGDNKNALQAIAEVEAKLTKTSNDNRGGGSAAAKITADAKALGSAATAAEKEIKKVTKTAADVATAAKSASTGLATAAAGSRSWTEALKNGVSSVKQQIAGFDFGSKLQKSIAGVRQEFDGFAGRIPLVGRALVALGPIGTAVALAMSVVGASIVTNTLYMERLETRIKGIVGSSGLSSAMSFVQAEAKRSGQALDIVADGYARFLALQKAGITTTAESKRLLSGFNDAAMALGASSTQVGQTLFGLAQGLTSGTLRAEELNQVVEPMPGLLQQLDKAAGLSAGGFRRMVNDGKVSADFFRSTLLVALESYRDGARESANTTDRAVQRMSTAWTNFTNAPWLRGIMQGGANTVSAILEGVSGAERTLDQEIARRESQAKNRGRLGLSFGSEDAELKDLKNLKSAVEQDNAFLQRYQSNKRSAEQSRESPAFNSRVEEITRDASAQEKLNAAKVKGAAATMEATAAIEIEKRVQKELNDLKKQGESITADKEAKVRGAVTSQVNSEVRAGFAADTELEIRKTDDLVRARQAAASASEGGARAQMAAARAAEVEVFARERGTAAATEYAAKLKQIDEAELSGKRGEAIRSLTDEAKAIDIVTAATGGSIEAQLEAERSSWLVAQATNGIVDASGRLEEAYKRKQAAQSRQAAAETIAQLQAETAATLRLVDAVGQGVAAEREAAEANFAASLVQKKINDENGAVLAAQRQNEAAKNALSAKQAITDLREQATAAREMNAAVREGNRDRIRQLQIEAEVTRFTRENKLEAGDPKIAEYRAAQSLQYAAGLEQEAFATELANNAALRYSQGLAELEEQRSTGIISEETYTRRLRELTREKLQAARDWKSGAVNAFMEYSEEAGNAAKQVGNVISNSLRGTEDAFVKFALTGKSTVKDMMEQITADVARAVIRMAVISPIINGLTGGGGGFGGGGGGGGFGSILGMIFGGGGGGGDFNFGSFHTGGIVGSLAPGSRMVSQAVFANALRFHGGGLVGDEVPIIAKKREGVFTPQQMQNADGLIAAALARPAANVNVQIINKTDAQVRTESTRRPDGTQDFKVIFEQFEGAVAQNVANGKGKLTEALQGRYGLSATPAGRR